MQRAWESELARRIEERTAELRQAQQLALQAIDDVASTVARMREFYRGREPQLVLLPADLNSLANQVLELTRARWSDMPLQRGIVISVATALTPELPFVLGIESEVREALTNLVGEVVKGLMPEAIRAVTDTALRTPEIFRVQATCDVDNRASARALEKSGFSLEGRLERYTVHPNISFEPRPCFLYARCR